MSDTLPVASFTDRFSDPKVLAALILGCLGIGFVVGMKVASGPTPLNVDYFHPSSATFDPVAEVFETVTEDEVE
jgi:hypothetical protein